MKVETTDGWLLDVEHRIPQGEARGSVLLTHAMMVDRRTLDKGLADAFLARGWHVWLADFRGHGRSGPSADAGGSWTYDDLVFRDLPALVQAVRRHTPGRLVYLGQSLGGHVGVAAAAAGVLDEPPEAWILLSTAVWLPSLEPSLRLRIVKTLNYAAFYAAARLAGRYPARRLRMGPCDEALPYVRDLVRFWRTDRWASRGGFDYLSNLHRVTSPVLAITGAADSLMAREQATRNWTAHLPRSTFWRVGEGDHGLDYAPDHMGLATQPRSRPVWEALLDWLET